MNAIFNSKEPAAKAVMDLDPLVIALGLSLASLAPGFAGEAGAVAAIAFDVKCKRWYGVILSSASMIPIIGYLPAVVKVGLLVVLLNRQLMLVEAALPELQKTPEVARKALEVLEKYKRNVPKWKITRGLRQRLERIMASGQCAADEAAESTPAETGNSAMMR